MRQHAARTIKAPMQRKADGGTKKPVWDVANMEILREMGGRFAAERLYAAADLSRPATTPANKLLPIPSVTPHRGRSQVGRAPFRRSRQSRCAFEIARYASRRQGGNAPLHPRSRRQPLRICQRLIPTEDGVLKVDQARVGRIEVVHRHARPGHAAFFRHRRTWRSIPQQAPWPCCRAAFGQHRHVGALTS